MSTQQLRLCILQKKSKITHKRHIYDLIVTRFCHIKHIPEVNAIFLFNRVKSQDRYFNDVLKCSKYYRNSWTNRFFVLKINEIHIFKQNGQLMNMKAYAAPRYCKNQVKQVLGIHIDSPHSDKTPPVTTSSLKRCVNRLCLGQTRKNSRLRTQVEASVWIEPPSCWRTVGDQPLT